MFHALPAAVYTTDREGRVTAFNEAAAALWGRRPALGEDRWCGSWRLYRPDGTPLPRDACPLAVALREGRAVPGEEVVVERPDGTRAHVLVHPAPLRDAEGEVVGAVNLLVDVTEQRAAEHSRGEREASYRTFLALSQEGIWRFDLDEPIPADLPAEEQVERIFRHAWLAECNAACARMYGFDRPEEIVGARLTDFLPPDDPANRAYLRAFVESRYRLSAGESHEVDREGRPRVFENTLMAEVAGGCVVRAWGTQRDVTARKEAERAQALLAAIVASSDDAIVSKTLDGTITSWNAGAERVFGYTAAEAVGQPVLMLIPPERHAEEDLILERLRRGERVEHYETVRLTKDGRRIDVSLTISPVRDAAGHLIGASKVARKLTEQKQTEAALRESEAEARRLAAVVARTTSGVVVTDPDGRVVWANDAFTRLSGYTLGEVRGRRPAEVLRGPESDTGTAALVEARVAARAPFVVEVLNYRKDGTPYWTRVEATPLHADDGAFEGYVAVQTDVTERKQAEAALRESEARFRQLVDAMPQIAFTFDDEGAAAVFNRRWFEYTGDDPTTTVRERRQAFLHPADRAAATAAWERAVAAGEPAEMEYRLRRHDGAYRWHLVRVVPIEGADGARHWLGTSTDIHAQKEAEAELAAAVAERTRELQRSNRELDQFAYVASHDLKGPLRGIKSLVAWITEDVGDDLPEASRQHLDLLRGRALRMEALLDSLLDYSRAGRKTGLVEDVDTAALVRDVAELLALPAPFAVEVEEGLPRLSTYRAPLELVFRNLLANAAKHHDRPDGRVRVSAVEAASPEDGVPEGFVTFAVADDGPGIPAEYHDRIFGLFQTLRPRDEVEGSGMGLAVVKKTVESLGGSIRVESTPGEGTTFWFTWPRQA